MFRKRVITAIILVMAITATACREGGANTAGDNETGEVSIETTATTEEARSETVAEVTSVVTEEATEVDVSVTEATTTREPEKMEIYTTLRTYGDEREYATIKMVEIIDNAKSVEQARTELLNFHHVDVDEIISVRFFVNVLGLPVEERLEIYEGDLVPWETAIEVLYKSEGLVCRLGYMLTDENYPDNVTMGGE